MSDITVSFRVDERLHAMMRLHDEINWSAIVRRSVKEKLEQMQTIDKQRAQIAAKRMDDLAKKDLFNKGKKSVEVIREWRDKRK